MERFPTGPRHRRTTSRSTGWRVAVATVVVAVLTAIAGIVAYVTGRSSQPTTASTAASVSPSLPAVDPSPSESAVKDNAVASPPSTSDPVVFAKAAAKVLWTYDTRNTPTQQEQLAGLKTWMTHEEKYNDFPSVSAQIPDPVLWSRMRDQKQYATATVAAGHYPQAFKSALAQDPAAITEAYIYVVTVIGKQKIAWHKGGGGAESRSVTLAVQCRPKTDCALAAIAPRVYP
ncbi:hypothetical protein ACFS5L_02285 [Streptomyces phyllanthi]|uniref:Uncharacterized protein n=1 Tax=Streptomyces phyllanthi TaxID=1803180 RepID=A0A5N8VTB1_9ACTN|nr:hypothetical protein [Streptomyces phyllanthi]MPY38481.1 hypothetical protein [Streptomyces phyllanthi]